MTSGANITTSLDSVDVKRSYVHSTWAGTFTCQPELYFKPANVDQIKAVVVQAGKVGKTVMLTGSGHSPSKLTMTKDWLMNLDKFNKLISVNPHSSGKWTDVTVEAGMRVYQLNEILAQHNLAIQNLGSISDQSIGGIFATGTHGSTAYHGLVSQQIVDFTLMVSSGDLIRCSPTENQDLFRAGLLSLGKLGIITHATIRAIPSYTLASVAQVVSFDRFVDELWPAGIWTSSEFMRVWWFPYSKRVILWRADKSTKEPTPRSTTFYDTAFGRFFYEALLWVAVKIYPALTPKIERWVFSKQFGFAETYDSGLGDRAVHESVQGHNMDCLFSQFVNEWGMPLTEGPRALRELEAIIDRAACEKEFYVHAPFEVRISNTTSTGSSEELDSDSIEIGGAGAVYGNQLRPLLDPTPKLEYSPKDKVTNDNLTLYLNATMYRPFGWDCPIDKWYQAFEKVVSAANGKPHWAKNFLGTRPFEKPEDGEMRGLQPTMSEWFGEDLELWKQLRQKNDPQGVFLGSNDWAHINGLV